MYVCMYICIHVFCVYVCVCVLSKCTAVRTTNAGKMFHGTYIQKKSQKLYRHPIEPDINVARAAAGFLLYITVLSINLSFALKLLNVSVNLYLSSLSRIKSISVVNLYIYFSWSKRARKVDLCIDYGVYNSSICQGYTINAISGALCVNINNNRYYGV